MRLNFFPLVLYRDWCLDGCFGMGTSLHEDTVTNLSFSGIKTGIMVFLCIVRRPYLALYHSLERGSCKTATELEWLLQHDLFWRYHYSNSLVLIEPPITYRPSRALSLKRICTPTTRYHVPTFSFPQASRVVPLIDNETPQTTEVFQFAASSPISQAPFSPLYYHTSLEPHTMANDKLGENDKPDWSGPTANKFDKYGAPRPSTLVARAPNDCLDNRLEQLC